MRAKFIWYVAAKKTFVAVFNDDTNLADLSDIASVLQSELPDIKIRVTSQPVPAIEMVLDEGCNNKREALVKLKELTQPELPYTLHRMVLTLLTCICGNLSTQTEMAFLNGLEPLETFKNTFHKGMLRLPVAEVALNPTVSFATLLDALEKLLTSMRIHVTYLSVVIHPEELCVHRQFNSN